MTGKAKKILALSGGVGGAKLALGLSHCLATEELKIVANTGDDFIHLGLNISPDLDTVMYTLAGVSNAEQGWGLAGETWQGLAALQQLGCDTWFQLGDKDLATHIVRTHLLRKGLTLSEVTDRLCRSLGVHSQLLPMSDDPVMTIVETNEGDLPFQHYFVRERCRPVVRSFRYDGVGVARPQTEFVSLMRADSLAAIVICPSNPFVSVAPILALRGVREAIRQCSAPVIAVSPIVAGAALKGPAAKMMQELSLKVTAFSVAEYYGDLLDGFVIDNQDAAQASAIEDELGIRTLVTTTIMRTLQDRIDLASQVIQFSDQLK